MKVECAVVMTKCGKIAIFGMQQRILPDSDSTLRSVLKDSGMAVDGVATTAVVEFTPVPIGVTLGPPPNAQPEDRIVFKRDTD